LRRKIWAAEYRGTGPLGSLEGRRKVGKSGEKQINRIKEGKGDE
jgi:hypothetical protein